MELQGKTIFVISYENWGPMLMSKHHYAIELAKEGNQVYFINHPDRRKSLRRGEVKIEKADIANLFVVHHRLIVPYFFKFKFKSIFNFFVAAHIRTLIRSIKKYPDVVWSFDTGNTIPLKYFTNSKWRILMPVDGPFNHTDEERSADNADVIISVTERILNVFQRRNVPKLLINHGVAGVFLNETVSEKCNGKIKIGYSGSLIRGDLDVNAFLEVINNHPDIDFEFWGETDFQVSNIHLPQDVEKSAIDFIDVIRSKPNVVLHGPVSPDALADGLRRMDALLIFYKIKDDQNHHKVLEYLGTGKAIVSNFMSSYATQDPDLLYMDQNERLPSLFNKVVSDLSYYNSTERQQKRKTFASKYSYSSNIRRIDEFLAKNAEN